MTLQNYQTGQQLYSLVFGLASHFNSSPTQKCGRQNFECVDLLSQQYSSPVTGSLEMKLLLTFFYQVRIQDLVKGGAPGSEADSCRRSKAESCE